MFKNVRKEDLRVVADELGLSFNDDYRIVELKELIENSGQYKKDPQFVAEIVTSVVAERKSENDRNIELEKMKLERVNKELELAKLKSITKDKNISSENRVETESLDTLIKSVRILTLKIPSKPEAWGLFFSSLERAFSTKKVPEQLKAEILLNLLGDRAANVITYIKDEEFSDYEKIKSIVLREFEPTPQICLDNFKRANRQFNESYVQFASRLMTNFEYYLKLRKVSSFEDLKQLIVSDKLYETLNREIAIHINIKQEDTWFPPITLGKEIDLYLASRGKLPNIEIWNKNKYENKIKGNHKVFFNDTKSVECKLCASSHALFNCSKFKELNIRERMEFIKNQKLCFLCFKGHFLRNCNSKYVCRVCNAKHNSLICVNKYEKQEAGCLTPRPDVASAGRRQNINDSPLNANAQTFETKTEQNFTVAINPISENKQKEKMILLATAIGFVSDTRGQYKKVRFLIDGGSTSNFLTNRVCEQLTIKRDKINMAISCLSGISMSVKSKTKLMLTNEEGNYKRELEFFIVPCITQLLPTQQVDVNKIKIPEGMKLADPEFNIPGRIDGLLGAEVFLELIRFGQVRIPQTNLMLQNTVFGNIVSGSTLETIKQNTLYCGFIQNLDNLNKEMEKFWEIESSGTGVNDNRNPEEKLCDEHFAKTYKRNGVGQFIVKMPFKKDPNLLGESKTHALKTLNSLWFRLIKNPYLMEQYRSFMEEYRVLGHMEEVSTAEEQKLVNYLPHHAVYRPEKSTTKLRVVFNGSHVTSSGESLNSLQLNGGVIQRELFDIIVKFRTYRFAFSADIKKMYRTILIDESQKDLQRIVWKDNLNDPVKIYKLCTVTYGLTSAPYLATRCLKQLAMDGEDQFPLAASILRSDIYMDDILSGGSTLEYVKKLQEELILLLNTCKMELHKWFSNDPKLRNSVIEPSDFTFQEGIQTKALGLIWKSQKDLFAFQLAFNEPVKLTKRVVLSSIARIFDPLGLLGPIVTRAKLIMQKLWRLEIGWDEDLPSDLAEEWLQFRNSLRNLKEISCDRYVLGENPTQFKMLGFADASESAYGAAIYVYSKGSSNQVTSKLLCSKGRVAPLKTVTIPRLELCAAVLLSKLMNKVANVLNVSNCDVSLYSDSTIVLSWLRKVPADLKTFVASRVSTIQGLTKVSQWFHVPSSENPADLISRGLDPVRLANNKLWWYGPTNMNGDAEHDSSILDLDQKERECFLSEIKSTVPKNLKETAMLTVASPLIFDDFFNLSNNLFKLIRIFSYVNRFINNVRIKSERSSGSLSLEETSEAESTLLRAAQVPLFERTSGKLVDNILSLNPFVDDKGVVRVGGRLKNSSLQYSQKHPAILPKGSKLVKIIFSTYHLRLLHVGPQALLNAVRMRYWPLNGKNIARQTVHSCVICFKSKPVCSSQIMGNLPRDRLELTYVFNHVGIDLCGPFAVKYKNQRKGTLHKIYVCVFVCFVTRAIHLEVLTDLTSEALIASLKRFFARRGKSSKIFTDNATNFVGAKRQLKRLYNMINFPDSELAAYFTTEGIDWKFIPAKAPHFGGLWEAGVKSVKHHLKRTIGNLHFTYEEFETIIIQIEGILNSRPITPLSNHSEDYEALTPGHFLVGRPISAITEPQLIEKNDNRLSRWQRMTKVMQLVWKRWKTDYLNTLQQRSKWMVEKNNLKEGQMVLIKEDYLPMCKWTIGRIIEVIKGNDKKVRIVRVKTPTGEFKRPISKLAVFPEIN